MGGPQDGANYLALLRELRTALDELGREQGRRYGLSVAVNVTRPVLQRMHRPAKAPLLDQVFMMSYDYHGAWNPHTGHHAALQGAGQDDSPAESVTTLRAAGVPAQKLAAGAAFYGRAWRGAQRAGRRGGHRSRPERRGRCGLARTQVPGARARLAARS
ncbi:MAG: glycosyl hydrolase family 18 protein [Inhella sp.]